MLTTSSSSNTPLHNNLQLQHNHSFQFPTPTAASMNNNAVVPKTTSVGAKIDLLKMYGLSLGDVYNLNRLAI